MIFTGALLVWVALLTFWVFRIWRHYNKLTAGATGKRLAVVLNELLEKIEITRQSINKIEDRTDKMRRKARGFVQTVKFLRFNPFAEVGGDQSFIIAFLDEDKNGVVVSSLHSRETTRWFAKKVKQGKGVEHKLSKEEEKVVNG